MPRITRPQVYRVVRETAASREHLPEPDQFLGMCQGLLRSGGGSTGQRVERVVLPGQVVPGICLPVNHSASP